MKKGAKKHTMTMLKPLCSDPGLSTTAPGLPSMIDRYPLSSKSFINLEYKQYYKNYVLKFKIIILKYDIYVLKFNFFLEEAAKLTFFYKISLYSCEIPTVDNDILTVDVGNISEYGHSISADYDSSSADYKSLLTHRENFKESHENLVHKYENLVIHRKNVEAVDVMNVDTREIFFPHLERVLSECLNIATDCEKNVTYCENLVFEDIYSVDGQTIFFYDCGNFVINFGNITAVVIEKIKK